MHSHLEVWASWRRLTLELSSGEAIRLERFVRPPDAQMRRASRILCNDKQQQVTRRQGYLALQCDSTARYQVNHRVRRLPIGPVWCGGRHPSQVRRLFKLSRTSDASWHECSRSWAEA